jgi:hypothetical protein
VTLQIRQYAGLRVSGFGEREARVYFFLSFFFASRPLRSRLFCTPWVKLGGLTFGYLSKPRADVVCWAGLQAFMTTRRLHQGRRIRRVGMDARLRVCACKCWEFGAGGERERDLFLSVGSLRGCVAACATDSSSLISHFPRLARDPCFAVLGAFQGWGFRPAVLGGGRGRDFDPSRLDRCRSSRRGPVWTDSVAGFIFSVVATNRRVCRHGRRRYNNFRFVLAFTVGFGIASRRKDETAHRNANAWVASLDPYTVISAHSPPASSAGQP